MERNNFTFKQLPKDKPFKTPKGYFEGFSSSLQDELKLIQQSEVQKVQPKRIQHIWNYRMISSIAAIALFAFIITATLFKTTVSSPNKSPRLSQSIHSLYNNNVTFEDLASELNEEDLAEIIYSTLDY